MRQLILLVALALASASYTARAGDPPGPSAASPLGRWVTASGNLEVEVAPCGEALCGSVVRVLANRSMSRAGGEMKAADPRDPMGMQLLIDFLPTEFREAQALGVGGASERVPTQWKGQIYNRENAKTYRCDMWLGPDGELMLRGYIGLPWFGSTSAWTRAGVALGGVR